MKEHWERVYQKNPVHKLGWYETSPEPSLGLIEQCKPHKDAVILNVGTGATTLVDELIKMGFQNIIANDISGAALEELQNRLGSEKSTMVRWIVDDLTDPAELKSLEQIDLWHDRAVLHFFNEKEEQDAYFSLLRKLVKVEGWVILAAFNLNGALLFIIYLTFSQADGKKGEVFCCNPFWAFVCQEYTGTHPLGCKCGNDGYPGPGKPGKYYDQGEQQ